VPYIDSAMASESTAGAASRGDERGFFRRFWRPLLLVGLVGAGAALGFYFDVGEHLSKEKVRALVDQAGWWGPLVFVGIFTVGQLVSVPGIVFVAAAVMAWGKWPGIGASYAATIVSSTAGFFIGRLVGGDAMHQIRTRWFCKALEHLDRRPIAVVTGLVAVLWMAPPLNYGLGMTHVRWWKFLAGTAIGLIPGLLATGLFFDWITRTFL
jgi:uncharacterized membrane protein YdjX (TVP38/TMEM64 family)